MMNYPFSRRRLLGRISTLAMASLVLETAGGIAPATAKQQGASLMKGASGLDEHGRIQAPGLEIGQEYRDAAIKLLRRAPSVDVHTHPGRFFLQNMDLTGSALAGMKGGFEDRVIQDMKAGDLSAALFSTVSDLRLLGFTREGGIRAKREFEPGEAFADYKRQINILKGLVANGSVAAGLNDQDITAAHKTGKVAAIFSCEGGDFIEDRLERVQEAYNDGVRSITIVHYHINQIGDIQTEAPVHGGLTKLGEDIVREMNKVGIIVDLAHAPYDVCKRAIDIATRPVMVSHTNLMTETEKHPRLITAEHAKMVASHGGIIGSVPSGVSNRNFADYVDSILRLVDTVGAKHVAIGTDIDANYKPVFANYRDWPLIPAALLSRGLSRKEVRAIMGGNFMRLFTA